MTAAPPAPAPPACPPSVEVHVPITLNRRFAVMCRLLAQSLAARAAFPGDWKIVFTLSLDSTLPPDDPELAWAADLPVEFRWVDRRLFVLYSYDGTGLQRHRYPTGADVLLYMDADIVVTGPLTDLVHQVARSGAVHGWPAWQPPRDVDLATILRDRGVAEPWPTLPPSGWNIGFRSPAAMPPYFNFGFIAMPNAVARDVGRTIEDDMAFLYDRHFSFYSSQIVLMLNILRLGRAVQPLPMRYNCSNGDLGDGPALPGPEAAAAYARAAEEVAQARILHLCVDTPDFAKRRDMADWDALRAFIAGTPRGDGGRRVQAALRGLV
ncbi:MAG: hypothetical protein IE927_11860 [Rhodobacterales bacterium]|nr:hypothetical protein [Rhodobacterales bacterium]